jgi:hypothetical protein
MSIDASDDHDNADDSIQINRELDSNEIDESDSQCPKHDDQRISAFRGISIDSSNDRENVAESIRVNREFDSSEPDENDRLFERHDD